ncbi:MAG: BirA family biotin operon repressor/biotin-[acetyl-CoA-carboxylase] ligase [Bacteroidia bacterium]|jgi:BirA family biotin operon repressor/biotin-[acetyl-CoA-carboxylase] ligase
MRIFANFGGKSRDILQIFNPQTLFIGQSGVFFKEVDSTNSYLKEETTEAILPEGFYVRTDFQRNGRGQGRNVWNSERGVNLLMSFVLRPDFLAPQHRHGIAMMVALAIRALIQQALPTKEVRVKWPNDIFVGNKKIAGVLIENMTTHKKLTSIVGIGINVLQKEFPQNIHIPTSLFLEKEKIWSVQTQAEDLCWWLEKYYLLLRQDGGMKRIQNLYVSQLYRYNECVKIEGSHTEYLVKGVDDLGRLILQNQDAVIHVLHNEKKIIWS